MRSLITALAVLALTGPLAACTGAGNNLAAVQAMNNPPNTCGPGGRPNVEDCRGHP